MMRKTIALLLALPMLLAPLVVSGGEELHQVQLADGSILKGRVIELDANELVIATPYNESLRIPREQVLVIALTPAALAVLAPAPPTEATPTLGEAPAPAGEGILEVAIKGDAVRSSSRYRRSANRERITELNRLHLNIIVDGKVLHRDSDGSIEKEFQDRGWTWLRNSHHFATAVIPLPAGQHRVQIIIGNQLDLQEQGEEQPGLVSAELNIEEVIVRPDEKTRIVIQGKSSKIRYGAYEMELLSRF